jgi:Phytanoyl-CoA dioxygenase (PhyH)
VVRGVLEEAVPVKDGETHEFIEVGYVVLRRFFDPLRLTAECERAIGDGVNPTQSAQKFAVGRSTVSLQYVPMMCELTPVSLDLASAVASVAEELFQRPVLPGRAKGTKYVGDTSWHRDSEHDVASLGCIAYLNRLTAETGALRIVPRSHRRSNVELPDAGRNAGIPIDSEPGDVIVFDEHIIHGSSGGRARLQWRADFVVDPADSEIAAVQEWFAQSVPDERRDLGYNARQYPSYGPHWRSRHMKWTARLIDLGVLDERSLARPNFEAAPNRRSDSASHKGSLG